MKYTKHGLQIGLDELEELLEEAKNQAKYRSGEDCIYISGGKRPEIKQYYCYAECYPKNYTYGVTDAKEEADE